MFLAHEDLAVLRRRTWRFDRAKYKRNYEAMVSGEE